MITPAREVLYDSPESFADDLEARAKKLRGKYSAPAKEHLLSDVGKLRDGLTLQNIDKYLPVLYERRCTLLDYLPEDAPLFVCEAAGVREELRSANRLMTEDMKVLFEEGVLFEGCDRYLMDYDRIGRGSGSASHPLYGHLYPEASGIFLSRGFTTSMLSSWRCGAANWPTSPRIWMPIWTAAIPSAS